MNNKKVLGLLLGLAIAAGAQAGEMKFDFRSDLEGFSANDTSGRHGYQRFNIQTARLDYKGNVSESLSYRARVRFNKDLDKAVNYTDSMNASIDYFMLKNIIGEGLGFSMGKFAGLAGGYEGQVPGSDTYLSSVALGALSNYRYYTGLAIDYKIGEATTLLLHVANQDTDQVYTTGTAPNTKTYVDQKRFLSAFGVEQIMGDHKALLTYTQSPQGADITDTFLSAGMKMKFDTMVVDAEYLANTLSENSGGKDDTVNSIVLQLSNKGEQWSEKVKVDSTVKANDGEKTHDVLGLSVVAEYKPVADQDFRYHFGVNQTSTTPKGGDTAVDNTVFAGVKLGMDILK